MLQAPRLAPPGARHLSGKNVPAAGAVVRVLLGHISDARVAGSAARRVALGAGYDDTSAGNVGIVAQELASNVVRHGGGGALFACVIDGVVALEARDRGDGEPLHLLAPRVWPPLLNERGALRSGLGRGLEAVLRLVDGVRAERRDGGLVLRVELRRR